MARMPLLWLSVAFLLGLLLGKETALPWPGCLAASGLCILLSFAEIRLLPDGYQRWRRHLCPLAFSLLLGVVCLGAARYGAALPRGNPDEVQYYTDKGFLRLAGTVSQAPERTQALRLVRLDAQAVTWRGQTLPVHGGVMVWLPLNSTCQYGDRLELQGSLVTPPVMDDFSYKEYLANQGMYALMRYPQARLLDSAQTLKPSKNLGVWLGMRIERLRQVAYAVINRSLPQPEAALLNGILLGLDRDLPEDLQEAFRATGTAHIIAISGFNIAVLAGLVSALFSRLFPRFYTPLFSLLVIGFYTLLVGAGASVVRAAIMGGLSLMGHQLGRRQAGLNTLAFTAAAMCLFTPALPWDVSFQLSFCATLGLILFAERLQAGFIRLASRVIPEGMAQKLAKPVGEYFLFTLAAQAVTLPVIGWHFGRISLSAVLVNPLVLPAQPLVMLTGGLALLGGLVWPGLGRLLGGIAWLPLTYTIRVVELFARLPWGSITLGAGANWILAGLSACILALALPLSRVKLPELNLSKSSGRISPAILAVCLVLGGTLLLRERAAAPDGRLHVTIYSLQPAPVLLIQSPSGARLLLNSTEDAVQISAALSRRFSLLDRRIDGVLVTARAKKPLAALAILAQRFPLGTTWISAFAPESVPLEARLDERHVPAAMLETGMRFDLGGARLSVLGEDEERTTLCLTYANFRLLLPGPGAPGECSAPSVLLLGADDLKSQPPTEWQSLGARMVLYQASDVLADALTNWLDFTGHRWVSITSDGQQMWVEGKK